VWKNLRSVTSTPISRAAASTSAPPNHSPKRVRRISSSAP
jgi:hypothetical protein